MNIQVILCILRPYFFFAENDFFKPTHPTKVRKIPHFFFETFPNSNHETLKRKLFEISQNDTKTKRGKYIAVQPTALACRNYKHRGRMVSSYGRRVKDTGKRAQMICDDTSDTVYFTLPKQKPRAKRQAHSLQASIQSNKPNAKKHQIFVFNIKVKINNKLNVKHIQGFP